MARLAVLFQETLGALKRVVVGLRAESGRQKCERKEGARENHYSKSVYHLLQSHTDPMKRLKQLAALLALLAAVYPLAGKKKKPEEITQTLEQPKDPPLTVTAETSRLTFHISPLSAKGLLSQQMRDAIKALLKSANGATIVKLRAFVAGRGDLRRVPAIVSETFTEKHLALPAVSVIQVGILPMEGAQVVIESIAVAKKEMNPLGLVFVSGQGASSDAPVLKVAPLAEKSMANLKTALQGAGSTAADVLRVTCFCSSLEDHAAVRGVVEPNFPHAALDFVQTSAQRVPRRGRVRSRRQAARKAGRRRRAVESARPDAVAELFAARAGLGAAPGAHRNADLLRLSGFRRAAGVPAAVEGARPGRQLDEGRGLRPSSIRSRPALPSRCAASASSSSTSRAPRPPPCSPSKDCPPWTPASPSTWSPSPNKFYAQNHRHIRRDHAAPRASGIRALPAIAAIRRHFRRRRGQRRRGPGRLRIARRLRHRAAAEQSHRRRRDLRSCAASAWTRRRSCAPKGRMGVYYVEAGANQRPSKVVYDRDDSSIALAKPGDIDWDAVFDGAGWFHITGITPALSASAAELALESVQKAREKGLTVSCDLNYRKNLWKYGKSAAEVMRELVKFVDIGIANEEDCQMALGIKSESDVHSGKLDPWRVSQADREGAGGVSESESAGDHAARIEERVAQWMVGVPV